MDVLIEALPALLSPINLLMILLGTIAGIIVGSLPGLTPTMGVAVLVPFTFTMDPVQGLLLLGAVYGGAVYGGSITAVLLNIPGAPANVATALDGNAMARRGEGEIALHLSVIASTIGGLVGFLALIFLAPPLAHLSLKFGPAETFWLAVFGITVIASLSVGSMIKGIIGGAVGMLLALVGQSTITGTMRYTFGTDILTGGVDLVAGLIGLFAVFQTMKFFEETFTSTGGSVISYRSQPGAFWRTLTFTLSRVRYWVLGSIVGTIVGIIPGAGGQVASLVAYNEARRSSPEAIRKQFGTGLPEAIIAPESSNNAMVGASLIPLLTLGIPGSPTAAVLLGGLLIHGLLPGPDLFTSNGHITYTFMIGMILTQFVMLAAGALGAGYFARVLNVPHHFLAPAVMALCLFGAFSTRQNMGDVTMAMVLGMIMYLASKFDFEPAAITLGMVLGTMAEDSFMLSVRAGQAKGTLATYFFSQPLTLGIISLTVLSVATTVYLEWRRKRQKAAAGPAGEADPEVAAGAEAPQGWVARATRRRMDMAAGVIVVLVAVAAYLPVAGMGFELRLFPSVLAGLIALCGIILTATAFLSRDPHADMSVLKGFPGGPMLKVGGLTLLCAVLAPLVGFYTTTFLYLIAMAHVLSQGKVALLRQAVPVALGFTIFLYLAFGVFLQVLMPSGFLI